VRGLVDTLRQVTDSEQDVKRVFDAVVQLSNDSGNFSLFYYVQLSCILCKSARKEIVAFEIPYCTGGRMNA
jgi:hypothetical protein